MLNLHVYKDERKWKYDVAAAYERNIGPVLHYSSLLTFSPRHILNTHRRETCIRIDIEIHLAERMAFHTISVKEAIAVFFCTPHQVLVYYCNMGRYEYLLKFIDRIFPVSQRLETDRVCHRSHK